MSGGDRDARAPGRGFWAARDIPTVAWLLLAAAAALAQRELPMPRWLLIHLLLLGAVTHAILVWSQYFSFALLRSSATVADRRSQTHRLALVNGGAVLVLAGLPLGWRALAVAGAAGVVAGAAWHGASLVRRMRGSLPGRFGRTIRYYVAAAAMLVFGGALGAWLAAAGSSSNLVLAHALLNVLGWIGLTVAGTVVTLWPTILRTRADEFAPKGAARALPALAAGVAVAAVGAVVSLMPLLLVGLIGYLAGLIVLGVSLLRAARRSAPRGFAGLSVGAALLWWAGCVVAIVVVGAVSMIERSGFAAIDRAIAAAVPFLAAGFAAQILVGALSYLVPVVLGGGPGPVRAGAAAFDRFGRVRVATANAALIACALPLPDAGRTVAAMLYLAAMASFLPIMLLGMRAQRRAPRPDPPRA